MGVGIGRVVEHAVLYSSETQGEQSSAFRALRLVLFDPETNLVEATQFLADN